MTLVINPTYQHLLPWVESLPKTFSSSGRIIYNERNQIRVFEQQGLTVCVKRFHPPIFANRIVYTFFRDSKAKRSYENGLYMLAHGVGTPEPVAYIEEHHCGLICYSYLVTLQSKLTRLNREFTLSYTTELEDTIRPLAQFTAHMHNEGILHLDFSPGNILWDTVNGKYQFELLDLNRMRIAQPVTLREGAKSLRRICARTSFFITFADEYAKARHMDKEECLQWILYYRDRFWHKGKKAHYQYD